MSVPKKEIPLVSPEEEKRRNAEEKRRKALEYFRGEIPDRAFKLYDIDHRLFVEYVKRLITIGALD